MVASRFLSIFALLHIAISPSHGLMPWRGVKQRRRHPSSSPPLPTNSYVPDGLTPEEYQAIKLSEATKRAQMDFAAWGPRFRKTSRPDGDWMVMPNLWTLGQVVVERRPNNKSSGTPWKQSKVVRLLPVYSVTVLAVHLVLLGLMAALRMKQRSYRGWIASAMLSLVATRYSESALEFMNRKWLWSRRRWIVGLGTVLAIFNLLAGFSCR